MIIGVTGNFGSGKSTVSKILARIIGARVIDADKIAKKYLYKYKEKVFREFPESRKNNSIDTRKLAEIVFEDKKKLEKLEKILHPSTRREIEQLSKTRRNVIIDAPLLIEGGLYSLCDLIILVKTPKEVQIRRLKGKFTAPEIEKRLKHQIPFNKKKKYADYVINNNSSLKTTRKQVELIWEKVRK